MKAYKCTDSPVRIYGLNHINAEKGEFWRLEDEDSKLVSDYVRTRSKTAGGGRVRFRTNVTEMKLQLDLKTLGMDICMPICGSSGADVYSGTGLHSRYIGFINPLRYDEFSPVREFKSDGTMQDITINLPRNEEIKGLTIYVNDEADVLAPTEYSVPGRICFYGSSITEGGCSTRPGNAYTCAAARWLDSDYMNLGFSGAAKGEDAMADIIKNGGFSALVYDYDHNAPTVEHLRATHERFFLRIRAKCPDMPVIMMSKPDFDSNPLDNRLRREIIMSTYAHALASGDKNVYFIDGETLFGVFGREMCTVDITHPNDLGFYRMAEKVYAMLVKIFHKN